MNGCDLSDLIELTAAVTALLAAVNTVLISVLHKRVGTRV